MKLRIGSTGPSTRHARLAGGTQAHNENGRSLPAATSHMATHGVNWTDKGLPLLPNKGARRTQQQIRYPLLRARIRARSRRAAASAGAASAGIGLIRTGTCFVVIGAGICPVRACARIAGGAGRGLRAAWAGILVIGVIGRRHPHLVMN